MTPKLEPVSTRIPKDLAERIEETAKAHGLNQSEYLRGLITKAMEVTVPGEATANETMARMDDLAEKLDQLHEHTQRVSAQLRMGQEGMASLAAMLATLQGRDPEEAKTWARRLFFAS